MAYFGNSYNYNLLMKDIQGKMIVKAQVLSDIFTMGYVTAKLKVAKLSTTSGEIVKAAKLSFKMVDSGTDVGLASLEED